MKKIIKRFWPVFILVFLEIILIALNTKADTYLIGWDNMMPEFDFPLNIKRTLASVWQEYRGLGYEDGMSHAANLIHYILLWLFSLILPQHALRYGYIFLTHLLGGIGVYILLTSLGHIQPKKLMQILGLTAALFYQYCFATIQMYYLPFEPFVTQFAFLPWLFYGAFSILHKGIRKGWLFFSIATLLSTPQAHVPTVFLVYALAMGMVLLGYFIASKGKLWKRIIAIIAITFCLNAFWGLPFAHNTLTQAQTITQSKNNQVSNDDTYEKNHAFGNFSDTALMRSFSITYIQYDYTKHADTLMMQPWVTHTESASITALAWLIFFLTAGGGILILIRKKTRWYPFVFLYLFSFSIIGNDIPGLRIISDTLRSSVPLFAEVFRFVFTKFFILYAFSASFLFTYAVGGLTVFIIHRWKKYSPMIIPSLAITGILFWSLPSFTGDFLFRNLNVTIPSEYTHAFSIFQKENPNGRILVLPMPWYWGWTQYRWGVIGSGFFWFGVPQPLVDRAFDPWSDKNENLYWEVTQAIYQKNTQQLRFLLEKYNIAWIIIDENIMHPVHDRALYLDAIRQMIADTPSLSLIDITGRMTIYKNSDPTTAAPLILVTDMPNIGPFFNFNDYDTATESAYVYNPKNSFDIHIPFRTLFTGRDQSERQFDVFQEEDELTFSSELPISVRDYILDDTDKNGISSIRADIKKTDTEISVVIPAVKVEAWNADDISNMEMKRCDGKTEGEAINNLSSFAGISRMTLQTKKRSLCFDIDLPDIPQRNGYLLSIKSSHIKGRRLFLSLTNKETKRTFLETFITPSSLQTDEETNSYFIIPPMDYYGQGYSITIDNNSLSGETSINTISNIALYEIPYETITSLRLYRSDVNKNQLQQTTTAVPFEHPNPAYYKINLGSAQYPDTETLILSQAFDAGWKAYEINTCPESGVRCQVKNSIQELFPFIFGRELKNHVLVNNWENGWELEKETATGSGTIILFFLPQLLQYFGYFLLPLPFVFFLIPSIRRRKP